MALAILSMMSLSVFAQGLAVRSSASYQSTVAPGSAATLFVSGLLIDPEVGSVDPTLALPRSLAGVTVLVDSVAAQLGYVSENQINFVVPVVTREGVVAVEVLLDGVVVASGSIDVARLAPDVFSADGSGSGAGLIFNAATYSRGPFVTETREVPGCDKRTRLLVYATGIRYSGNASRRPADTPSSQVEIQLEDPSGVTHVAPIEAVGPAEDFPGIDEVVLVLPSEVADFDSLQLRIVAEGIASNSVTVSLMRNEVAALDCADYGGAFVFNTVADLLGGDLWDVSDPTRVFTDLAEFPADWLLTGVGTTALNARNGEVIATGSAGAPELVWSDPDFPPTVRSLSDQPIPFVGAGAGNPASVIRIQAEPGIPIHQQVVELARERGLAFASVRVEGRFAPVSYSVAHNLLKSGTPLTDPTVDKAPFQLFFTANESAEWELSGFYAAAASVQELISVRGAPLHLHGFQLDRSRAGHVGSAIVENAEIQFYPLGPPVVRESDLTLRNVVLGDGGVGFEVWNAGFGSVTRATVQVLVGRTVLLQAELSDVVRGEPRVITAEIPSGVDLEQVRIVVDPFNDVFESDESNNAFFVPRESMPPANLRPSD